MKPALAIAVVVVILAFAGITLNRNATQSREPRTFNLSEFGVAITLPASLNDVTYTAVSTGTRGDVLHLHTDDDCELATIDQIQKDAIKNSGTEWTAASLEAGTATQSGNPAPVKEFTDFYLVLDTAKTTCATEEEAITAELKKRSDLQNALGSARYIQF